MKKVLLLASLAGALILAGCGDDTTGPTPVEQPYFPMAVGDYWTWDYAFYQDLPGVQSDSTEAGTRTWTVDQLVTHQSGFQLYQVTLSDSIVLYYQSTPVDTAVYSYIEYYRVTDDFVRYYYSLEDTTFWLELDLPLYDGKTWYDVENALYTVMSMDTTLSLPFGTADSCAWVQEHWGEYMLTWDNWFYQPGVGPVKRVFRQEYQTSEYVSTWELTGSSRL